MQIDPRGPRFAAALTTLVLIAVLLSGSGPLLALQAVVFGLGAFGGPHRSPYGWLYRTLIRPRLAPPAETEDERPPRFAQAVGLVFATVGTLGFLTGVTWLGLLATAFALAAAFFNAAFGYCLGCEVYLLIRRAQGRPDPAA
ncbi:DUF4395 domain-containing protein [Kitasatospora sp. NPDC127111]|uniref:DUF4395 domain-containing protein n=1 Tax=Kitasatospora sp. NPDC127111 TaxID=3345363 RepID=UPI0036317FFA